MFIAGTAGFALASCLGGIAPSAAVLILARILQGAAGALLTTGSLSLLRSTFGDESGRAIGIWATGTGAVSLGGPPLGGALVEWASWRWIFFLNVPLAIVAISLAWVAHRGTTRPEAPSSKLDVLGAGLVALGIGDSHLRARPGRRAGVRRHVVDVSARRRESRRLPCARAEDARAASPALALSQPRLHPRQRCHPPHLQRRRRLDLLPRSLPAIGRRLHPLSDGSPSPSLDRRHPSPRCSLRAAVRPVWPEIVPDRRADGHGRRHAALASSRRPESPGRSPAGPRSLRPGALDDRRTDHVRCAHDRTRSATRVSQPGSTRPSRALAAFSRSPSSAWWSRSSSRLEPTTPSSSRSRSARRVPSSSPARPTPFTPRWSSPQRSRSRDRSQRSGTPACPRRRTAAEAAEAAASPLIRLDPASPDCPASLVHREHAESATAEAERSAPHGTL